jgi:hypothetical protein
MSTRDYIGQFPDFRRAHEALVLLIKHLKSLSGCVTDADGLKEQVDVQMRVFAVVLRSLVELLIPRSKLNSNLEVELADVREQSVRIGGISRPSAMELVLYTIDIILLHINMKLGSSELVWGFIGDNFPKIDDYRFILAVVHSVLNEEESDYDIRSDLKPYPSESCDWLDLYDRLRDSEEFRRHYTEILFPAIKNELKMKIQGFDANHLKAELDLEFVKATRARVRQITPTKTTTGADLQPPASPRPNEGEPLPRLWEVEDAIEETESTRLMRQASLPQQIAEGPQAPDRAPNSAESVSRSPLRGYLGLELDEGRRVVRRVGTEGEVDLSRSRVLWGLLRVLLNQRDKFISIPDIRESWSPFGRADTPEDGTIHDAISKLRGLIKSLGVTIENRSGIGYRLVKADSE